MAYRNEEDIFNEDVFDFVVRFEGKAITHLNNQKNGTFDDIKKWISDNQYQCIFSKKNEDEHKLLISIENENRNIEITLKWQPKTFDYKAVINKKSKRIIREYEDIEVNKYFVKEDVNLNFIDFNQPFRSPREQEELYEKICKLEISPKTNIENQQEIWEKWIEAQELILEKNSQPIEISSYDQPIDVSPIKMQFRTKLKQKENPEYGALQEALKEPPFEIKDEFEGDTITLTVKDIFHGLDKIISKDFSDVFERDKEISCLIKIGPLQIADIIQSEVGPEIEVRNGEKPNTIEFFNKILSKRLILPSQAILKKYGLKRKGFVGSFLIINKHNLRIFDSRRKYTNSKVDFWSQYSKFRKQLHEKRQELINKQGAIKVNYRAGVVYEIINVPQIDFDENYWNDLKRELYDFEFNIDLLTSNHLGFKFEDTEDLRFKFNKIKSLNQFNIIKSPLDVDFKFKVKVNLIAKKSQKEAFEDKLKNLAGVEFRIALENKETGRKRFLPVGNLAAKISDYNNLVFNLPYKWKDEKKQTDNFLKFIDKKPRVNTVTPNLRGDQAKISWLSEAMNKVNNPQEGLDTKPVNEKLKEFVFDSSKATEIFRDLSEDTEDWNELKRHELLTLNNSQRRAILSALHATDLALLQGPPGTGKTTVIAEMIWQMIRTNQQQRILLTSETNLAVDNALEKLLNKEHTIVKPIRFGRASKFEEEGKKYSFERIMKWIDENIVVDDLYENEVNEDEESEAEIVYEDFNNNAVQLWMRRIADNSHQTNPKYGEIMRDWAFEMAQPQKEMKTLFKDKYFKYCNVVGSTSSSAGSPNFGADYQNLFNEKKDEVEDISKTYFWHKLATKNQKIVQSIKGEIDEDKIIERFVINGYNEQLAAKLANIYLRFGSLINRKNESLLISTEFDTVITDEASKATPPELLLPMCYGKKNIIIGDHRQLPPMLHDKSFKEVLETLETKEAKELAEEIDKDFVETSQFERLITHPNVSPTIKSSFNEQYRMHPKINNVIKQFYLDEEGLEPGKPIIKNADDTNLNNPFSRHHGFLLKDFIKPDIHTIWIDVDEPEEKSGTSRTNTSEVEAISLVLKLLKKANGFTEYMGHWDGLKDENKRKEEKEIGLISFYGHQVGLLREVAKYSRSKLNIPVRLNTVDKFQGMERNIIIVSTVRSNQVIDNGKIRPNRDIGFAKSPQRLNVALSRAKRLLIVVGNKNFFSQYQNNTGDRIYKNVIEIIGNEGMIINYNELKKKFSNDK
ncbi:MAG: AAA family ATPase [Bacteroidetes bacterium]|nr:AAA family ATPase [Bacteroidota bacterium]